MGEKYNLTIVSFYGGHATYDFREKTLQEIKTLLSPFMIVVGERGNRKKKEAIEDFFSYFRMEIFLRNSSGYAV